MYTNRRRPSHATLQVRSSVTDTTYRWVRGLDFHPEHPQQPHPRKPGTTRTEAMPAPIQCLSNVQRQLWTIAPWSVIIGKVLKVPVM